MNKKKTSYGQDLRTSWFLPLRLAIFLIVFGVIVTTQGTRSQINAPFFAYGLLTLMLLFALALRLMEKLPRFARLIILLQIVSEVVVEAQVIGITGNITSPFSALFLLTIVSAALAYQLAGTLFTATMASAAFSAIIWSGTSGRLSKSLNFENIKSLYNSNQELFYTLFLYICTFYLVAFVAGYLSQKIKSKDRELRAASESLARVKLETDEILKHLHSGLITIDHFGRVVYFNRAAEKITGYKEYNIKGKGCLEAFADRMPQFSEKMLSVLKSAQHEQRCEVTIADKSGNAIPIGISTSLLEDQIRGVRGVVGIFQDLTEAKRLEEKMRHADRLAAVGELSASIAHEIRNPLASISGSVEILRQELNVEGENLQLMNLIVKEASRLSNILTDFLVYARVRQPMFTKVEVNRLVSDIIEVVQKHPAYRETIKLKMESDDTTVYASGDEEQIKQILLNLIVNAMEAIGDEKGTIQIKIEGNSKAKADQVSISVHDDGRGMNKTEMEKIFAPFFSTKKHGTGLGLAIVRRLLDNMGGKVSVESSTYTGTVFAFSLIKYFEGMPSSNRGTEDLKNADPTAGLKERVTA